MPSNAFKFNQLTDLKRKTGAKTLKAGKLCKVLKLKGFAWKDGIKPAERRLLKEKSFVKMTKVVRF